jgi:hypothetical protein
MENTSVVTGWGDAGGPIDSRLDDLCNHVGFTGIAAQTGCWRHFRFAIESGGGAERSVAPLSQTIFEGKTRKHQSTLSKI